MACSDCYAGHVIPGTPTGSTTTAHGLQVYVTDPPSQEPNPKARLVMISDLFGWKTTNTRLLADSYAARTGCRVYVPDYLQGSEAPQWVMRYIDSITTDTGLWNYLAKPWMIAQVAWTLLPLRSKNDPHSVWPRVKQWMDAFRCAEGKDFKIGVTGFCGGGYHVTRLAHCELAANGRPLVDAAFTAHPSEIKLPEDIENIKVPFSVSIGDVDFAMSLADVERMRRILKESGQADSEVVVIPKARHGFAVRADPDNKENMAMAEQALVQAVNWFRKHLLNTSTEQ